MSLFGMDEYDERDAFDPPDDDGVYHCGECHEASAGNRCDVCHAGVCEGCGKAVLHEEIGDRVPDDPTLMWCKPCAVKVDLAERANEIAKLSRYNGAPLLSETSTRETLIRWLQWCDPNGCHTDELAKAEDCDPYTAETAWDALAGMIIEASL